MAGLEFPRLIYRGDEDPHGLGAGETKRCETASDFEQDEKDGWRLERDPNHHAANASQAEPVDTKGKGKSKKADA